MFRAPLHGTEVGLKGGYCNVNGFEHALGRTKRAISLVGEYLPATRSAGDKSMTANILVDLSGYLVATDDLTGAVAAAREAIEMFMALQADHVGIRIAIESLALVSALRGRLADAAKLEGFVEVAFGRLGFERDFTESATRGELAAVLRAGLSVDGTSRLSAEGAGLALDDAVTLALERA